MKVKNSNATNEILHYMKANILDGVWKPGEKIETEMCLAKVLGVGRSSVHHAIHRLVGVGVLKSYQGKGIYVSDMPIEDLKERLESVTGGLNLRRIVEFRLLLETEICRRVAPYISAKTLSRMEECISGMEANRGQVKQFVKYDNDFHRLLVASTHNDIVIQSFEFVCTELRRQSVPYVTYSTAVTAINHHKRILEALRKRDADAARQAMTDHLYDTDCEPPFDKNCSLEDTPMFAVIEEEE